MAGGGPAAVEADGGDDVLPSEPPGGACSCAWYEHKPPSLSSSRVARAHIGTLARQVGADENIALYHADAVQWLASTDILSTILDKLYDGACDDSRSNAAAVLTAIANAVRPPGLQVAAVACQRSVQADYV
eukprot:scaffold67_cov338-Prasinococcus_capsulatus_cf.AAC.8